MKRRNFIKHGLTAGAVAMVPFQFARAATMPVGYTSVKAYGAKGDGYTDDSAAVQAAMNATLDVWFPAGTYLVGNLKLRNSQRIAGEGATSVLRQKPTAQWCVSANPGTEGYADPAKNLADINVVGLRFEGQAGKVAFNEHMHLLNLNGVSRVYIADCQFIAYVGDGIYLGSSNMLGVERHNQSVTIKSCLFDGVTKTNRNGITVIDGSDILIQNCSFSRTGRSDMPGAIDLEPDGGVNDGWTRLQRIVIDHCLFQDVGAQAFISLALRPNDMMKYPANSITICGCTGYGNGTLEQVAILMTQNSAGSKMNPTVNTPALGLVIADNYFENTYRPFTMVATKGVQFVNTTFYKSQAYAYMGDGAGSYRNMNVSFKGCTFKQLGADATRGGAGLYVCGNDYVTFDTCLFEDCGAANLSGGLGLAFGGTTYSSYIKLLNTTVSSPLKRTNYAIRVQPSHSLYAASNQQSGTTLIGCANNNFLPK